MASLTTAYGSGMIDGRLHVVPALRPTMFQPVRKGLSLVEVLSVLAIIGIVIAMLIPAALRVRYANTGIQCRNNLKQLMQAVQTYELTEQRVIEVPVGRLGDTRVEPLFPPGCMGPDGLPEDRLSWMVAVLPYLEQESLYRQFDMKA